jgi:hypothetical protein
MVEEFPCETACPVKAARNLGEMATQLVANAHEWLFADSRTEGVYSVDAVRTASAHFQVSTVPENPLYGEPRDLHDKDLLRMRDLQFAVGKGTHLSTDEITFLQRVVTDREKEKQRFLNIKSAARARILKRAVPFLDRVALTLMSQDEGLSELYDILGGIPISIAETERGQAKPSELRLAERLYTTDQAPFIVARQALKACSGPMLYAYKPLLRGERIMPICPNSKRDERYWKAVGQVGTTPPDVVR